MTFRHYVEARTSVPTNTDGLGDNPHTIATQQLIPQIARKTRNAVAVARIEFYFLQRKQTGRRCSCFILEVDPDGTCPVCFTTGKVGGYDKYGCISEIFDVTRPGMRLFNVRPAYERQNRPVLFTLDKGATYGFFEADVVVQPNTKMVDIIHLTPSLKDKRRSHVTAFVKSSLYPDWDKLTEASLSRHLYDKSITIRVVLDRQTAKVESPLVSHLLLRYRILKDLVVFGDIPKIRESIVYQEWGITDNWETLAIGLTDTPRKVTNEDIFVMKDRGIRWKVVEYTPNQPAGILIGIDVSCRLVTPQHPYYIFPV